jgi:ribosome-associated translation inhibitor RaiA
VNQILALLQNLKEIERKAKAVGKEEAIKKEVASLNEELKEVRDELIQAKIKFPNDVLTYKVKLNNKIAALNRVVARGDAAPTDQSYQVFDKLSAELDVQLKRLKDIIEKDIPAFNRLIQEEGIPAVPVVKK